MLRRPFRSRGRVVALALAGASLGAIGTARRKDGPPPAHTGGFGEPTCRQCHFDAGLNEPGGTLALRGAPGGYQAGRTYELVVALRRAGMLRAGFQLAARFSDGPAAAKQAGSLEAMDARVAAVRDTTGIVYIQHTLAGTALPAGGDSAFWTFRWTAPPAGGPVIFHLAANAANDDDSPLGDFIYTVAVAVPPRGR